MTKSGDVRGNDAIGGMAGTLYSNGLVTNCYATGVVKGSSSVGGVAGNVYGKIANCYATGEVIGDSFDVGGVAGNVNGGSVRNCAALNPAITRTSGYDAYVRFNRIAGGYGSYDNLENNVAWRGMTVMGDLVNSFNADSNNGADISADNATDLATYAYTGTEKLGWKFGDDNDNPWKWDPWQWGGKIYMLPILYWQTSTPEMPEHLQ